MSQNDTNDPSGNSILRNATYLMSGQFATWTLTLALTIVLPRYLGPSNVGKLHLAQSLWAMGGMVAAFGMDILLTKEIARQPNRTAEFFGTTLALRAFLYLLTSAGMAAYVLASGYPTDTAVIIGIIGISQLFNQLMVTCKASLEGLERMEYTTMGDVALKGTNTFVGIAVLLLGGGVYLIAVVSVAAMAASALIQLRGLNNLRPLHLSFSADLAKWMMKASIPYMLSALIATAYVSVDIVVISLLIRDETQIGWYGAADKLFGTLMFIPNVFLTVLFPTLSRMYAAGEEELPDLISRGFNLLLLFSVPVGLGIAVLAGPVVVLLFGPEFAESGPILSAFGIVIILTYQTTLLGRYLISMDRQNIWTAVMGVALMLTIGLDIFLIPLFNDWYGNGAIGGVMAYIITEGGMVIAGLWLLPSGYIGRDNLVVTIKALLAGGVMGMAAWALRDQFILFPIAAGGLAYLTAILLLQAIPSEDMAQIKGKMQSVWGKLGR